MNENLTAKKIIINGSVFLYGTFSKSEKKATKNDLFQELGIRGM